MHRVRLRLARVRAEGARDGVEDVGRRHDAVEMAVLVVDQGHRNLGLAQDLEGVERIERVRHDGAWRSGADVEGLAGQQSARIAGLATTPIMLSGSTLATGRRECGVDPRSARMSASSSSRSIQSTSVRGVITPRTARSPRRRTPAIMLRSSVSITPAVSASATTVLISSSVTASRGSVSRPKRPEDQPGRGVEQARRRGGDPGDQRHRGRDRAGDPSALRSARCLGTSSPMTTER